MGGVDERGVRERHGTCAPWSAGAPTTTTLPPAAARLTDEVENRSEGRARLVALSLGQPSLGCPQFVTCWIAAILPLSKLTLVGRAGDGSGGQGQGGREDESSRTHAGAHAGWWACAFFLLSASGGVRLRCQRTGRRDKGECDVGGLLLVEARSSCPCITRAR